MKKIIYISLWLVTAIACKKDQMLPEPIQVEKMDTASNGNIPFQKLISSLNESTPHAYNASYYSYDDHGRLAFFITDAYTELFNYKESKLTILRKANDPEMIAGRWEAELNAKGAITKLAYYDSESTSKSLETFEYDTAGYMISRNFFDQTDPAKSYEEKYIIKNGLLKQKTFIVSGVPQYEIKYIYGETRTTLMLQTAYAHWVSKTLFGKTWERAATGSQQKDLVTNKITNELTFENTVDTEGYVIGQTTKDKQHATVSVLEITY